MFRVPSSFTLIWDKCTFKCFFFSNSLKSFKFFFFSFSKPSEIICRLCSLQKLFFFSFPHFLLLASMVSCLLENIDVPCIIKSQIISVSKAASVVSLKGKRESKRAEMCSMPEIQSNWSKTLIGWQSPLSEALNLTMPHLIWCWQLGVYLHCTEIPKRKRTCLAFTISFLLSYYFLLLK